MKELNTLDKVVIEIAIDDFKDNKLKLSEVTRVLSSYEHQQYETGKYRKQLNEIMAKKYVQDMRGDK